MTELGIRPSTPPVVGSDGPAPGVLLADWFDQVTDADAALRPRLMRYADGRIQSLPVDRWAGPVTPADKTMLVRAQGPVLDVGCGPGRLTAELHTGGVEAVGLDLDEHIPALARAAGAPLLVASVWGPLPRPGQWGSVLLADGNVGIGGDPVRLLGRLRGLLRPDGVVLVELQPSGEPPAPGHRVLVRLEELGRASTWFPWGQLGAVELPSIATSSGLRVADRWSADGREFAALRRV